MQAHIDMYTFLIQLLASPDDFTGVQYKHLNYSGKNYFSSDFNKFKTTIQIQNTVYSSNAVIFKILICNTI
jgi:hypothetical protein